MGEPATAAHEVQKEAAIPDDAMSATARREGPVREGRPSARSSRKAAIVFIVQFAAVLFILALPWRGLDTAYARSCSAVAENVLQGWVPDLRLVPAEKGDGPGTNGWHTWLLIGEGSARPKVSFNLRYSYLPIAVFLALATAAPIRGWKRHLTVVGGGFALMLGIGLCLAVLPMFYALARARIIDLGSVARGVVDMNFDAFVTPTMMYAIPFAVWWALMAVTRPSAPSSTPPAART